MASVMFYTFEKIIFLTLKLILFKCSSRQSNHESLYITLTSFTMSNITSSKRTGNANAQAGVTEWTDIVGKYLGEERLSVLEIPPHLK